MKYIIHIIFLSEIFCQVYQFEIYSIPNMETPLSMNGNGTKIVGTNFDGEAVYWSDSAGTQVIGVGELWGISDNDRIFGELENEVGNWEAALVENGETTLLGNIEHGNACDAFYSHGLGISSDGLTGVGMGWKDCKTSAFYWTDDSGIIELGQYNGESTKAQAVSGNGQLIGGWAQTTNRATCLWNRDGHITLIGSLQENSDYGEVHAINNDGTQVVGYCSGSNGNNTEGFIWTAQNGMVGLGVPPNSAATNRSLAMDISENNVVVGQYLNVTPIFYMACIYTEETGQFVNLQEYLFELGMIEINDWDLQRALCVSDDGNTIAGYGKDPQNNWTGWVVNISASLIGDQQIMEDEELMMDLSYIGDSMIYDAHSDTSAVSVFIDGHSLLLSPLPNWHGISTITVYMTDENNLTDTTSFVITVYPVNDPPTIAAVDDISIPEDGSASIVLSVTDIDTDDLLYNFYTNQPVFSYSFAEDTLFVSPILNWNGQVTLTIYVSDGENSVNTSLGITVTPVNDPPLEFGLISPTVLDTFQIHTSTDQTIPFTWESSYDVDSELTYKLIVTLDYHGNVYTQDYENITDSSTAISTYEYAVFMTDLNLNLWTINYIVELSDGEFNIISEEGYFVFENTSLHVDDETVPEAFSLHQNYPNPFNPTTQIRYNLPEESYVNINIYDLMGRNIKSLINTQQDAGYRIIQWNATNDLGQPVSAGMYVYMIQAGEFRRTRKMVLLK